MSLDDLSTFLFREHCEPCESCGTSLMKRGHEAVDSPGRWQIETWAVPDGELMRFIDHTPERCQLLRIPYSIGRD